MLLLIDNYDSFSYNLYQMLGDINPDIKVVRNDSVTIEDIEEMAPEKIVLSPGPGRPEDSGICPEVIRHFTGRIPILGICLGHQAICQVFGGNVTYAKELMHGKQSVVKIDNESKLFKNLPQDIKAARYHSLAADAETIPPELKITAVTDDGEVMAVESQGHEVYGLQFHPESVLTPEGIKILKNFLEVYDD